MFVCRIHVSSAQAARLATQTGHANLGMLRASARVHRAVGPCVFGNLVSSVVAGEGNRACIC